MVVGGALSSIIGIFSVIIDQPLLRFSALAICWSMLGSGSAYQFFKTKEKIKLWSAIAGVVLGLAYFVIMIILGLKK